MTLAVTDPAAAAGPPHSTAELLAALAAAAASKDIPHLVAVAVELGRRLGPAAPYPHPDGGSSADAQRRPTRLTAAHPEEPPAAQPTTRAVRQTKPTAALLRRMAEAGETLTEEQRAALAAADLSGGQWR